MLSKLAELYLSMSSASVAVKAMFSTTGLNGKRTVLAPDKLNRISFSHENYAYLLNSEQTGNNDDF